MKKHKKLQKPPFKNGQLIRNKTTGDIMRVMMATKLGVSATPCMVLGVFIQPPTDQLTGAMDVTDLRGASTGGLHQRMVRRPLCDRIRAAWKPRIGYHELMQAVFPYEEYPLAWRYSHNGGPPVCAMAFGKALRKLGLMRYDNHISGTLNSGKPHAELLPGELRICRTQQPTKRNKNESQSVR